MNNSKNLANAIKQAIEDCDFWRHEFVTPEHVLYAFASQEQFASASEWLPHDASWLITQLEKEFLSMEVVPETQKYVIEGSQQFSEMMSLAIKQAQYSDQETLDVPHVVAAMLMLNDSQAAYLLDQFTGDEKGEFMQSLVSAYAVDETGEAADGDDANSPSPWRKLVTCVNDTYADHNPLIGREAELERTMQVLCRKDKNNPLHVGEPGVGKTALIYGLTALIERGAVPERLRGARVYMMDMGTMVAGTQFRGDFEKRIKMVMEGLAQEGNAILCIDEIHNLIGAGRNGDASLDASNMLKPYLESGAIRFIGSTTYDEYNRYIAKQKSLVRRFQQIDIAEPSVDDAIRIVEGLRPSYEKFHGVKYAAGVVEFAVRSAAKHIRDRFLPDKAIDLIDEAGAYRETHPLTTQKRQTVDRRLVTDILARVCKIDAEALKEQSNDALRTLEGDIKKEIFGQDEAVGRVVEAVQMSKAGLADDTKPMASLLFVGPTGVGKTEVARVLSERMGMKLVRFDMSEYAEKHAVAKLIGSPAGYVGYEDGGLLTAAVRKTPNCVLLFDEIEKAHPDIFNIFLQMMDYAALTDNHGERADFRNAIIIMTSNAGSDRSGGSVGFGKTVSEQDEARAVKALEEIMRPEFLNRIDDIISFSHLTKEDFRGIAAIMLGQLRDTLAENNIRLTWDDSLVDYLIEDSFSVKFGARNLRRAIEKQVEDELANRIIAAWEHPLSGAHVSAADGKIVVQTI